MSIEVRCPNPACAKAHRVKNKYAGKRGQCPDCGTWMPIPQLAMPLGASTAAPAPAPPELAEAGAWLAEADEAKPEPRLVLPEEDDEPAVESPRRSAKRKGMDRRPSPFRKGGRKARRQEEDSEVAELAEADEEAEVAELAEDEKPQRSNKRFGWVAVTFVALGALALGACSITPYLEGPSIRITGTNVTTSAEQIASTGLVWVPEKYALLVTIVPASIALLVLGGLMVAMATRNFGVVPQLAVYPAALCCVAVLALGAYQVFLIESIFARARDHAKNFSGNTPPAPVARGQGRGQGRGAPPPQESRAPVDIQVATSLGQGPMMALGSGGLALLLISIGALMMPRSGLGRILYILVVLVACAGGTLFVFGFADLPPSMQKMFGT